jgi:hypothetical protein
MIATLGQQHEESRGQDWWGRTAGTEQLGKDRHDTIAGAGQPDRTAREDSQDITSRKQRTRLPEQDSKDRTSRTGQLGQYTGMGKGWQVSWHRTPRTGQYSWDRSVQTG